MPDTHRVVVGVRTSLILWAVDQTRILILILDRCYAVVKIYRALYIPYSALLGGPNSHTVLQGIYSALLTCVATLGVVRALAR